MTFIELISVVTALTSILLAFLKWSFTYWQRRNFNYIEPSIPWGNCGNLVKRMKHISVDLKHQYDKMKARGWKHGGLFFFTHPVYMPVDLEYVKNVMTKDFQHFVDRGIFYNQKDDPLSANLFALDGSKWKNLRTKLTPTFTSGKMKLMFPALVQCVPPFLKKIEADRVTNIAIDIREVSGCFTTDIIGSVAFGLDCNSFKEENSPIRKYGQIFFNPTVSQLIKMTIGGLFPKLARGLRLVILQKGVADFFMKLVKDTVEYREQNQITRNDFLQLLIDLKNRPGDDALTIEEIAAQSFVFFLAGFETSSTTMTFTLYELARRPELQEKVRREIDSVLLKYDGQLTYDAIQEMKYMNQVIDESLRMYPPIAALIRKCVKDYKLPNEDVTIEKGTSVMLPTLAIHYDPEYYPEPEKFDPDRFSEENKNQRHPYAHLPFGEGPRVCIGLRFGLMQTKIGLASLLKDFKFTVNEKTQQPLKMKPMSFVLAAEGEIWLNIAKR